MRSESWIDVPTPRIWQVAAANSRHKSRWLTPQDRYGELRVNIGGRVGLKHYCAERLE
jgi:hypothetical protein